MLQLVLGRAGYGKTEYVFSSIQQLVAQGEENILLIVPEQFSFVAERRLLTDLGADKVHCVEDSSFSRLSSEIERLYGGDSLPLLSKGAKAVMMKEALETIQDNLLLFNKNITSVSFIHSVIKIYDEMKSCRVTTSDILEAAANTDKEILADKLTDIATIIHAYDALIEGRYHDTANALTWLYEKLLTLNYFKDRTVFIDGFNGFVAQEYKIIEVILKQAKQVYITFCSDSFLNRSQYDLFSYVNRNIVILKEVCQKAGVAFAEPILLTKNFRSRSSALACVEKFSFSSEKEISQKQPEEITLYCAKNIADECDYVAASILKLLRRGYRASEMAVLCRDLDKYEQQLHFSFQKYGVPYFDDERQAITAQPLMMFTCFLLRIFIYSYRTEDIFSLLKTGLTDLSPEEIHALENYVFLWNITGAKWKQPFVQSTQGFVEEISAQGRAQLEQINHSRDYLVQILQKFYQRVKNGTAADICKALYYALIDFSADKKLKELALALEENEKSALAEEQGRIWDLLMTILNELATVCGDKPMSLKTFYKVFMLMLSNEDLGSIPMGLDNVQLGQADRMRCDNPRAVFIVGANEGEFPMSITSAGLLTESDRSTLIQNDFKLYSYEETLHAQEQYFAYMALSASSERLSVSYRSGSEGHAESVLVRTVQELFPQLTVQQSPREITMEMLESKENAFELLAAHHDENSEMMRSLQTCFQSDSAFQGKLNAIERLYRNDTVELSDTALAQQLFKKDMTLSASRIEVFHKCAFQYFCKYGLQARPRMRAELDPMQTGTVIHYVLEQFIKDCGNKEGFYTLSDKEIALKVNQYLEIYLQYKMGDASQFTPRFKYQFMRLSKMLVKVVQRLRDEFAQSDFVPVAFELKIGGDEADVPTKKFLLNDGGSVAITGAVDRVDVFSENGVQYVRVVDYKSGNKRFQLSDILYGLNLQMFIYLFTICESKTAYAGIAGGVLYMHSARQMFPMARNVAADMITDEENKAFKMQGIVLHDAEHALAAHMERNLEGKYIDVKMKKDGVVTGNIATLEELGMLSKKIDALVQTMGTQLHQGKIAQNPVENAHYSNICTYCDYLAVCKNKRDISNRELQQYDNSEVLAIIKEEQDAEVDTGAATCD